MRGTPIVVMGVSGSGKTTIGMLLAARLGLSFVDGDDLQSEANKQRMAAGHSLTDADRARWLDAVAAVLARGAGIVACSALRRRYRDRLRAAVADVRFIHLSGGKRTLEKRIGARSHQYMPACLLDSQLCTLEPPEDDEGALVLDIDESPGEMVDKAIQWIATQSAN